MRLLPRLIKCAAGAAAVSAVTLAQLNLPSPQFWGGQRPLLYVAVVALTIVAMSDLAGAVFSVVQLSTVRRFDQELQAVMSAGISELARCAPANWREIGISVFHRRRLFWLTRLHLVDRLRLGSGPSVGARWRPGSSVVGQAFRRQNLLVVDWKSFVKNGESVGPKNWDSQAETYGLSWGQFMRTRPLVGLAACPVYNENGTLIGVVCVDAPAVLSETSVSPTLRDISLAVGDLGNPPSSWWNYVGRRSR